jgi:2,3-diketo-5-methylthiopentyl-1-phosphate enolase
MYDTYYNPEIFVQTFDGIDRDKYVVATYYMDDCLPGEDFIDHFALVQSMALEGSTGTWEKVEEDTAEMRDVYSSKLVGYFEIPCAEPDRRQAMVQLAFPVAAWGDNITMMLLAIAGNCFAYSPHIRLVDLYLGDQFLKGFQGPKFGVPGIRKLLGVEKRPLSLHIIKPKMGMTPEQVAAQCYQTAIGGADMMKDDEMTSDVANSNYLDRLKAVNAALDKAEKETGKRPIYLLSITAEPESMRERAYKAIDAGANGLLVTYSAGLGALRELTEDPKINVPVMLHA